MCLEVPELPVLAAAGKELCVRTHLCDSSVFEYYDLIRIHNGGESVRDHHARAPAASISAHLLALAARDVAQHLEDLALGERVHRARRLARGGGGGGGGSRSVGLSVSESVSVSVRCLLGFWRLVLSLSSPHRIAALAHP